MSWEGQLEGPTMQNEGAWQLDRLNNGIYNFQQFLQVVR